MVQDPDAPKDSGKLGLPSTDPGHNRIAPNPERENKLLDLATEAKVLARAQKRYDRSAQAEGDNRRAALEDRKFVGGEQWPPDVKAARNADKRPCLTVNKLPTFVHQVTNDLRQNRPETSVSPVGEQSDVRVAQIFRGLLRQIERSSSADVAYDTAVENAVISGWGYWRYVTEYERPDTFQQRIVIKRVRNPFTVYLGPHQEADGSDCKHGFVSEMMARDDFEETYPDADPMPWTAAGVGDRLKAWLTKDEIRVTEYFELEEETRTLVALSNGAVAWKDELSDDVRRMLLSGVWKIEREREAKIPKWKWYKLSAKEILEQGEWPGRWLPIVKVVGDELDVEGKVLLSGIVRHAKDSQRMINYWISTLTELVALAPKSPWVMEEGQIEGHEDEWQRPSANINVQTYKGTNIAGKPAPPPQRQRMAEPPAAVLAALQGSTQDMQATTGIRFDATLRERMVDESGRALRELRQVTELGSFHYADNLARSLRHGGNILLDLIPKVYDVRQLLTILRENGDEEQVLLDPTQGQGLLETQRQDGSLLRSFNPTLGRYAVTVTIGPSYATKRIESAQSMMDFARALPQTAVDVADLIAQNQDWPGAKEFAARLAKSLALAKPGVMTPDLKGVPPQVQALLGQLQQQVQGLTQERAKLLKMLEDQEANRAVQLEKINKDFEAKLLGIVQKAEQAMNQSLGTKLEDLAQGVRQLEQGLAPPPLPAVS